MTVANPSNYWISGNALRITLNANGDADYIQGNTASGAMILCFIKSVEGLGYDAGHNYQRWKLLLSPTYFATKSAKYVYVAIPRAGKKVPQDFAQVVFPSEKLDIYGKNASEQQIGSTDYYYIWLQGIISASEVGGVLQDRVWTAHIQTGTLSSDEAYESGGDSTWWRYSSVSDTVTFLKTIAHAVFERLRITTRLIFGNSDDSENYVSGVANNNTSDTSEHDIVTPAYGKEKYLSRKNDDTAAGFITFLKGILIGNDGIYGIDENGDAKYREIIAKSLQSLNYMSGLRGWNIDANGNAEVGTLHVRDTLEVDELRINRQQAQEGDAIFSDNDQILDVEEHVDETDGSTSYVLTLKEKWEGYFTAQMYGNILRGKINTLAAKEAGVSDYSEDTEGQERDGGRNLYYTSFMTVTATHNTTPSLLGVNQIRVVLWGDDDVPMSRNFPPCAMMTIARWGCVDYSDEYVDDPSYEAVKSDIKRRQQLFVLSSNDGRITKLVGVSKPILEDGNIGATFGTLPEFVKNNNPEVAKRVIEGRDYLYAQGVVVGDFIQTDIQGVPIPTVVNVGDWVDGAQIQEPSVGNGIYLSGEFNEQNQRYETHAVRHRNGTWKCLMHQPVKSGGSTTYYEPKWNSPYWQLIDGDGRKTIEFSSSNGYSFRRGGVNTVITPHLFYGNVEISDDIATEFWYWNRSTLNTDTGEYEQDEQDLVWNTQHVQMKTLSLSNNDMPIGWSRKKKAVFTCYATILDGRDTITIENYITV